jgi:uncharacterized membrane protein
MPAERGVSFQAVFFLFRERLWFRLEKDQHTAADGRAEDGMLELK